MKRWLLRFTRLNRYSLSLWIVTGVAILLSLLFLDRACIFYVLKHQQASLHRIFSLITRSGESFPYIVFPPIIALICYTRSRSCAGKMLYLSGSVLLTAILVNILKPVFGRARPDLLISRGIYGFFPFRPEFFMEGEIVYHSFPSGHSATAASVAVALSMIYPRGRFFFLIFAIVVAFSRVMILRHYPSDLFFGMLIGFLVPLYLYKYVLCKYMDR